MEDYTKETVINALLTLNLKTNARVAVDQKSYLIGILAYKFMMTEHAIAKELDIKRHTVNYSKKLALQFYNDKLYKQNVYVYAQLFPFDFSTVSKFSDTNRNVEVKLILDKKFYNKLKKAGDIVGHKDIRTTIQMLLEKSLKLWEE
jgi:hypothetical protein